MHVIHPATYASRPTPKPKRLWWRILLVLLVLAGAANYLRPLPAATMSVTVPGLGATGSPELVWPADGQAAVGAPGYAVLATDGTQQPLATASIAKVITALCVLQKQPLRPGDSGPTYTVSANDVAIYNDYVSQNGSVAAVAAGERLTERQALEAVMLPSANNVADSLVSWVFGSHDAYKTYATQFLAQHGLAQTTIGIDASGFDASTASSASDLTRLGLLALQNPVLMSIAGESTTTLPVAGTVHNYDTILGLNGVTGLKTGNNDQDPGAFLFTANVRVGSKTVSVTGAVMGAADLQTALDSSRQLAASMQQGFEQVTVAVPHTAVGTLRTAWGASEPITTTSVLQLVRWKDTAFSETHTVRISLKQGNVGSLQVNAPGAAARTNLELQHDVPGPSFWWRLTRH